MGNVHSSTLCDLYRGCPASMSLSARSCKASPRKSKSRSRSSSEMVALFPPVSSGFKILPSTSSGSGASSTVVDCRKPVPLARFAEARNEEEESFETKERDDALGVPPERWDVKYGPRVLDVRRGSGNGEMGRLFGWEDDVPICGLARSSHIFGGGLIYGRLDEVDTCILFQRYRDSMGKPAH